MHFLSSLNIQKHSRKSARAVADNSEGEAIQNCKQSPLSFEFGYKSFMIRVCRRILENGDVGNSQEAGKSALS